MTSVDIFKAELDKCLAKTDDIFITEKISSSLLSRFMFLCVLRELWDYNEGITR